MAEKFIMMNFCLMLIERPPVNPPKEIADPDDKKPDDWDDREKYKHLFVVCTTTSLLCCLNYGSKLQLYAL